MKRRSVVLEAMVDTHKLQRAEADSVNAGHGRRASGARGTERVRGVFPRRSETVSRRHVRRRSHPSRRPQGVHGPEPGSSAPPKTVHWKRTARIEKMRACARRVRATKKISPRQKEPWPPRYLQGAVVAIDVKSGLVRAPRRLVAVSAQQV